MAKRYVPLNTNLSGRATNRYRRDKNLEPANKSSTLAERRKRPPPLTPVGENEVTDPTGTSLIPAVLTPAQTSSVEPRQALLPSANCSTPQAVIDAIQRTTPAACPTLQLTLPPQSKYSSLPHNQ